MRTEQEKEYLLKAIDSFDRNLIVISLDYKILGANDCLKKTHGPDIVGELCYELLKDLPEPCEDCPMSKVMQTSKPVLRHTKHNSACSEIKTCLFYPIVEADAVKAMIRLDIDPYLLEFLEEKHQRTNAYLRHLILSAADGIVAADKRGKLLIFNEAAAQMSGYTVEEAINDLNIRDIYPEGVARDIMLKCRSEEYGGKGKLIAYQVDSVAKSGERIPISLNASIVYEGEEEAATIGFFRDLRNQLEMEAELKKTQIQLLQAEKMSSLGKLAAGVAHQLNNPLGGITLFTQLVLEEYDLPEGARDDLNRILRDAKRCSDTVKELLEFARQTNREMRPQDINKAVLRTIFLLKNQALFQNIQIETDMDEGLPLVPADLQQMNHLFMNIILNAADAMEGKGKLLIKSYLSEKKEYVCVEIADTGPGIAEDVLPHIFEPFFTTKAEGKGTGLGLSLVYGIVDSHKGQISAKSKLKEGTTFTIELPCMKK